jgi:hypothetical protein
MRRERLSVHGMCSGQRPARLAIVGLRDGEPPAPALGPLSVDDHPTDHGRGHGVGRRLGDSQRGRGRVSDDDSGRCFCQVGDATDRREEPEGMAESRVAPAGGEDAPGGVSTPMNSWARRNIHGRRVHSEPRHTRPNTAVGTEPSASSSRVSPLTRPKTAPTGIPASTRAPIASRRRWRTRSATTPKAGKTRSAPVPA